MGELPFIWQKALLGQGHHIVQVYARDFEKTQKFAKQFQVKACQSLSEFQPTDLIILAVSDSAIAELAKQIHELFPETLMVHTSGSTDIEVVSHVHTNAGCFIHYKHLALKETLTGQQHHYLWKR